MPQRRTESAEESLYRIGPQRTFTGEQRAQVAFPLGGIGTGSISLGGWGQLRDFEIFNQAKGQGCYGAFLTLFAQRQGDAPVTRVLQKSSSSTAMTFGPVKLRPTSIVRLSRVNSSTTLKSFNCPPRSVRSDTKS
jgi:hypothetical protein